MTKAPSIVCICGKPASGKSTLRGMMERLGWSTIEASNIIAEMLGYEDVKHLSPDQQAHYRKAALHLVSGPSPQPFSNELMLQISRRNTPIAISGIRNVSTLLDLSKVGTELVIVFMKTSYFTCVQRYLERGGEKSDYQALMQDPIEREWPKIYDRSHERIPNDGDLEDLRNLAERLHKKYLPLCK